MKKLQFILLMALLLLLFPGTASASGTMSYTIEQGSKSLLHNSMHADDGIKTWSSGNPAVVRITAPTGNDCGIEAVGVGTATVTLQIKYSVWGTIWVDDPSHENGGYFSVGTHDMIDLYYYIINVVAPGTPDVVTQVLFNVNGFNDDAAINTTLNIGDVYFAPVEMKLGGGSAYWSFDLSRLIFISSSPSVATVDQNGIVHAMGVGIATITAATADGLSDSYTVTVSALSGFTPISTPQQLNAIRDNPNGKYYLAQDIVFQTADFQPGGAFYNGGAGWQPIANFTGTLNGNRFSIQNLTANATGDAGLFARIDGGTVSNLEMRNCTVRGTEDVGCVVGRMDAGRIFDCKATGGSATGYNTGGIAGLKNTGASVVLCQNSADVNGTYYVGGIVGYSVVTDIWFCQNTGAVTGSNAESIGGIAGLSAMCGMHNCTNAGAVNGIYNSNTGYDFTDFAIGGVSGSHGAGYMTQCSNSGKVSVQSTNTTSFAYVAGGLVGIVNGPLGAIDCYNTGTVQVTSNVGTEVLGGVAGTVYNDQAPGTKPSIIRCYNTAALVPSRPSTRLGGIVGSALGVGTTSGNITTLLLNCYYINTAATAVGKMNVGTTSNVLALSSTQLNDKANFTGFDFNQVWAIASGDTPRLKSGKAKSNYFNCTVSFDSAGGSSLPSVTVAYGAPLAAPEPTMAGKKFVAWYLDSACTVQWDPNTDYVTDDMVLYARWATATQPNVQPSQNPSPTPNPTQAPGTTPTPGPTAAQPQSPGAYLGGISLSAGALSRSFNAKITSYTVNLGENDAQVTVTPVKAYDRAVLMIDGKRIATKTIKLSLGKSASMMIKVTWNKKSVTYKLKVQRAKSTANTLAALTASAGAWSQPFDPSVTSYTLALPENVAKVTLGAARASGLATVSPAKGSFTLKNGQTVKATFKVKAQSGAVRTYTVTITRAKSTNTNLSSLKLNVKGMAPGFSPAVTDYAITLPAKTASVTIAAKAADKLSTVRINGAKKAALTVKLANGQTTAVTVTVTAQSGDVKSYVITVGKQ